ncbi:MAG TPA: cyclopropane-fatty-acyl-phospholipid synthase family protein [Thermoanaerobaculia bacterium]|nr:cyclopropane-fatty-acyl-phospholipid synthase family protein [Thermoanaerobaculia bacterium]
MSTRQPVPTGYDDPGLTQARGERGRAGALERRVAEALRRRLGQLPVRFRLWDGSEIDDATRPAGFEVRIGDRATLWRLVANPELAFGDAYTAGRLQVGGDLVALLEQVHDAPPPGRLRRALSALLNRPSRRNSRRGSRENIHHHYDLGNDFYSLWLDRELVYTCAYYPREDLTLEEAQRAKMEHVCRKLRLEPGQRVVEAGSGWGALALYMARHHGVTVRSYNISERQVAFARERLRREGLEDRVELVHDDYRNIEGRYDAFVSVGMLEHVGPQYLEGLGRVIQRCLEPDGVGLVHTIGRSSPRRLNAWIERRIFPGATPPTLRRMMDVFEPNGLSVLDVENLRLHYALTLWEWLRRFDEHAPEIEEMFDESFVRAWRLYLSGSIAAFRAGSLQLFQVVFHPARSRRVALSRSHLYAPDLPAPAAPAG